ncbi:MAG: 1-aminocyclopropane-1-carboxylate deaminase/D-cysteine desulfhydrase [Flavobacteriales bacterium]
MTEELNFERIARIDEVFFELLVEKGIRLSIQRDDLLHPEVSGNKWRKLKYVIQNFNRERYSGVLTFGGPFSNHLSATAAACKLFKIPFVAIVRGEGDENNTTLEFIKRCGGEIRCVDRTTFRELRQKQWPNPLHKEFPNVLTLPEGGSSKDARLSCEEISEHWETEFTHVCCAIGTGSTFSGLVNGLKAKQTKAMGFVMLKDKGYLDDELKAFIYSKQKYDVIRNYHFNGFGKVNDVLIEFMNDFFYQTDILLDPVYTGKLLFGIFDLINKDYFKPGSHIIAIHTGGLQGIDSMNRMLERKKKPLIKT